MSLGGKLSLWARLHFEAPFQLPVFKHKWRGNVRGWRGEGEHLLPLSCSNIQREWTVALTKRLFWNCDCGSWVYHAYVKPYVWSADRNPSLPMVIKWTEERGKHVPISASCLNIWESQKPLNKAASLHLRWPARRMGQFMRMRLFCHRD